MSRRRPKKKSELDKLREKLVSHNLEDKKAATRKILGAMTVGKDVSMLFPDITKNMAYKDIELKKLVYLYIINYAKKHPEKAVMVVNSFRKDATNKDNPLLRALAVRTMGCIKVPIIEEWLVEPLEDACNDEDSYVRKTAAICIAKLHDSSPELM